MEVHAVDVDAGDVGLEVEQRVERGAEAEGVDAEHGRGGLAELLLEVGLGGAGEIEDAQAAALDFEALGYGDVEGVELDGRVKALAEGVDDAGAEDRADVVGDVFAGDDERDEEHAQDDADGGEPTIAGSMRAARFGEAGGRAVGWQFRAPMLVRCDE